MTSAHKNWSEPDDSGYSLSKDGVKLSITIKTTTICAEGGIKLRSSIP